MFNETIQETFIFFFPAISSGGLRKPLNGRGSFIRYFHDINTYIISDTYKKTHSNITKIILKIYSFTFTKTMKIFNILIFIFIIYKNTYNNIRIIIKFIIIIFIKRVIKIILKIRNKINFYFFIIINI